eukprot:1840122-Amphidinium_carterae.1
MTNDMATSVNVSDQMGFAALELGPMPMVTGDIKDLSGEEVYEALGQAEDEKFAPAKTRIITREVFDKRWLGPRSIPQALPAQDTLLKSSGKKKKIDAEVSPTERDGEET